MPNPGLIEAPEADASRLRKLDEYDGLLSQRVYLSLREAILAFDFSPGAILRKGPICEALDVSRSPVADAMARLSNEGLVTIVPQSATRVSHLSMTQIHEDSFLRAALELSTIEHVAKTLDDEGRARLKRNLRRQELALEANDITDFYEADEEFHLILMSLVGNSRLPRLASDLTIQIRRARMLILPKEGRVPETLAEHHAIFAAVDKGDVSAARQAMDLHLSNFLTNLEQLETQRPELFRTPDNKDMS